MEAYFMRCCEGPAFENQEDKKYEFKRLSSFQNWPNKSSVFPLKLAKAGFYYKGNTDEVICFHCGIKKSKWQTGDSPIEVHKDLNPSCEFVTDGITENIPLSQEGATEESDRLKRLDRLLEIQAQSYFPYDCVILGEQDLSSQAEANVTSSFGDLSVSNKPSGEVSESAELSVSNKPSGEVSESAELSVSNKPSGEVSESAELSVSNKPSGEVSESAELSVSNKPSGEVSESAELSVSNKPSGEVSESAELSVSNKPSGEVSESAELSVSNKPSEEGSKSTEGQISAAAPGMSTTKTDRKKQRTSAGQGSPEPAASGSQPGRGGNVADARAVQQAPHGATNTGKGSKGRAGKDSKRSPARDLDVAPPTGSELGPLRFERNRIETFKDWPSTDCVPAAELAKWGFYYTGTGDRVKCIFCKGMLRNWESGDQPHIEHRKHFPRCPLILGLKIGNVPLPLDLNAAAATTPPPAGDQPGSNVSDAQSSMETLGIITERPKHPQYAVESQRLSSFQAWPPYKYQTPQKLANAGFWYAGFNDNVKCFYCNGGLRNWEPGDEPWIEHARWFPRCQFVKQVKGQEFINKVLREKGSGPELGTGESPPPDPENPSPAGPVKFPVEERALRARMDRPDVKKVQDMGYDRDLIMKTLRKRFSETGDDFPSATALLESIFAMETDETLAESSPSPQPEAGMDTQSADDSAETQEADEQSQHPSDQEPDKMAEKGDNETCKDYDEDKENNQGIGNIKPDRDDLEKENLELREQRLCKICMTEEASMAFLPCGHLVSCASCSPALQNCPICRGVIKGVVRTYLA